MMNRTIRNPNRRDLLKSVGFLALLSTGCASNGNFTILGYTTKPQYDDSIKTVYVPIFQNKGFQAGPTREMEQQLTRAVIQEIEAKTPYKVVSNPNSADTELKGTIIRWNKNLVLRNQQNEVREIEEVIVCEIVWRDLRTGKVLSNPRKTMDVVGQFPTLNSNPLQPLKPEEQFDRTVPIGDPGPEKAVPTVIAATGRALPEAGESNATAQQMTINRLGVKIAQLMESPWELPPKPVPNR